MDTIKKMLLSDIYDKSQISEEQIKEWDEKAIRDVLIGYELMNAADLFFRRSHQYMNKKIPYLKHQDKYRASRQRKLVEALIKEFDLSTVSIDNLMYEVEGGKAYDSTRKNAYELARLVQLYYDRCQNPEAAKMVNKYLNRLTSFGMFTEEEIASVKMQ